MALSVPLSRSTLRVGGGSAFFVRHHSRCMNKPHLIISGAASLFLFSTVGCSHSQHPAVVPSAASASRATQAQLDQIQKDYGVVVMVQDHQITVGSNGEIPETKASQVKTALHTVYGSGFTNYAVTFIVD